jgi:histidine kinase
MRSPCVTAVEVCGVLEPPGGRGGRRGPLGDRGGRFGARMSVSAKKTAPPSAALAGQQPGASLRSLARVLPSGLASRVLAAGHADRQRIERDLHDGVQQRLTGLRIRLALAAEGFQERGDTDASTVLNRFGQEVEQAIEEVRAFARGVYPPILASEGLGMALVSASRYAPEPITVGVCTRHTPLPARGRERGLLHVPRGDRQCSQARRTGAGFHPCLGYRPSAAFHGQRHGLRV